MLVQFSTKIKAVKRLHTQQHHYVISHILALRNREIRSEPVWHIIHLYNKARNTNTVCYFFLFLHQDHRERFNSSVHACQTATRWCFGSTQKAYKTLQADKHFLILVWICFDIQSRCNVFTNVQVIHVTMSFVSPHNTEMSVTTPPCQSLPSCTFYSARVDWKKMRKGRKSHCFSLDVSSRPLLVNVQSKLSL